MVQSHERTNINNVFVHLSIFFKTSLVCISTVQKHVFLLKTSFVKKSKTFHSFFLLYGAKIFPKTPDIITQTSINTVCVRDYFSHVITYMWCSQHLQQFMRHWGKNNQFVCSCNKENASPGATVWPSDMFTYFSNNGVQCTKQTDILVNVRCWMHFVFYPFICHSRKQRFLLQTESFGNFSFPLKSLCFCLLSSDMTCRSPFNAAPIC